MTPSTETRSMDEKKAWVLYVLDQAIRFAVLDELPEVSAAISELIEADKEHDAAVAYYDTPEGYTKAGNERLRAAKQRRAAALARCQGEMKDG